MTSSKVILDTNIVSYLMKGGPLAEVYASHIQGKLVSISFITVGELYYGAEKANWGRKKRQKLETQLRNFIVIPYDHEIAKCYGRIVVERQKKGRRSEIHDAWIAACAVRHSIPLITNDRHFENITELKIITISLV